jgi:RNA polymerase sigma-70 factor (ECF subfamily)
MTDAACRLYERLLVLRCQAGEEAALGELIARYSPGLRFFLRKIVRADAPCDDLLQETWFDVYRKINGLQNPDAFAAWVYRIARDRAYRELRRRPPPGNLADGVPEAVAAEEETFTAEEAALVRTALDELPQEQREVLALRFIEDMSYEQIAEVVSCPVGTVRSRIHYAKTALRAKLQTTSLKKETRS